MSIDPELAHLQYLHPSVQPGGPTSLSGDGGFGGLGGDNEDLLGENQTGRALWETKHQFRKEMLPTFVDEEFGKMVRTYRPVVLCALCMHTDPAVRSDRRSADRLTDRVINLGVEWFRYSPRGKV